MKALRNPLMILGMIVSWSVFYAISKVLVDATGSAVAAGAALRLFALVFLTAQLILDKEVRLLFHQGRTAWVLLLIGVFGFLLDLFANLGYAGGSLSTGTALLKTDVLMVDLVTVALYHKKLYATDWLGTGVMLLGVLFVLGVDFRGMEIHLTDLFFLLSAACVTANAFLIKSAQTHPETDSDMISYYNNFVVLLLFSVSCGVTDALTPERLAVLGKLWPLAVLGGLAQTGIYFFYYRNLRHFEVWQVKLYLLLMPILSCILGVAFLGESLTSSKILGILIVLAGAALILLRSRIHKEAA